MVVHRTTQTNIVNLSSTKKPEEDLDRIDKIEDRINKMNLTANQSRKSCH